jgi:hypothetical protein
MKKTLSPSEPCLTAEEVKRIGVLKNELERLSLHRASLKLIPRGAISAAARKYGIDPSDANFEALKDLLRQASNAEKIIPELLNAHRAAMHNFAEAKLRPFLRPTIARLLPAYRQILETVRQEEKARYREAFSQEMPDSHSTNRIAAARSPVTELEGLLSQANAADTGMSPESYGKVLDRLLSLVAIAATAV